MSIVVPFPTGAARQDELRIRGAGGDLDIRIFSPGAGPARIHMPTALGFTIPVAMLGSVIVALQAAEAAAREVGAIGGDA